MDEIETAFREGLRRAVVTRPALGPIDLDEVVARGRTGAPLPTRRAVPRWLAAAAALALVAGLGVAVMTLRPQATVPAVPLKTPSPTLSSATSDVRLDGTWLADWIRGLDEPVIGTGPGDAPWLRFESATRAVANDVCNPLSADYVLDGAELTFGEWTIGTAGCGGSVIEAQAQKFHAALKGTTKLVVEGDFLRLQDAKGRDLVRFVREGSVSSVPQPTSSPTSTPTPSATGGSSSPVATATGAGVRVRVRNDSGYDLHSLRLIAPDDSVVNFGPIAAGGSTDYRQVASASSRPAFAIELDGTHPQLRPQATTGPPADLGPGTYTYVLTIDEESRVGLSLER